MTSVRHLSTFPLFVLLASLCACSQAFAPTKSFANSYRIVRYAVSRKPIDEAIAFYNEKFPFQREPPKPSPFTTLGMSDKMKAQMESRNERRRLTDISEKQARSAFQELAKLYGDDVAKQMVIDLPVCLSFERTWFKPSLEAYSEIFGKDKAMAMVARNPGLLAVKPSDAATVTDQTMTFSYLVAYTRPYSKVTLPLLFVLLAIPVVEAITGIQIRAAFFSLFPF
ncbi:hypothetical protein FisN_8Lh409 [Fistulifera solaris]|uniref:Uncharacterized protein n=1 Tax=Fistulifera solaris TaxID=1519565 RepID=A0A1Z5JHY5_FISSO|nr:hypothetical protein FisN_8Lh409 [Fistulifera solaris]|eukprot:GAX13381.1 hypothetical protein FisN_8Lh409 [Fistulifera solaris]